jgi:hypothetical protein
VASLLFSSPASLGGCSLETTSIHSFDKEINQTRQDEYGELSITISLKMQRQKYEYDKIVTCHSVTPALPTRTL